MPGKTVQPHEQPFEGAGSWNWRWAALLFLLAAVPYLNSLTNPFLNDDRMVIVQDPRVRAGDLAAALTEPYWYAPAPSGHWRPLAKASYVINWWLSAAPWTFRAVNVLLHTAASLLVCALARRLFRHDSIAFIAAGLFAVHPIHTEVINLVVGRAEILATLGVLGALLCSWRIGSRPSAVWTVAAATCFSGGLLSKETAITFPALLLLMDAYRRRYLGAARGELWSGRRILALYGPVVLVIALYLAGRAAVLPAADVRPPLTPEDNPLVAWRAAENPWLARWGTPVAVFGLAARVLVWPTGLSADYSYGATNLVRTWTDPALWAGLAWLAVLAATIGLSLRRRGRAAVALGLALVSYSLVANVVVIIGTIFGERLLYLPSVGACWALGLLLHAAWQRIATFSRRAWPRWSPHVAVALLLLSAGGMTAARNTAWRSHAALWQAVAREHPRSIRALVNLAAVALERDNPAAARQWAERAIEVFPEQWRAWRLAGIARQRLGDAPGARQCLERAVDLGAVGDEATLLALTELLHAAGKFDRALEFVAAGIAARGSGWYRGRLRRIELLDANGQRSAARSALGALLQDAPAWSPPRLKAAEFALADGNATEALQRAQEALQRAPFMTESLMVYVDALLATQRIREARQVLRRASTDAQLPAEARTAAAERLQTLPMP